MRLSRKLTAVVQLTTALVAHRSTWFTQDTVNELKAAGINTVRIPVSRSIAIIALAGWLIFRVARVLDRRTARGSADGVLPTRRTQVPGQCSSVLELPGD